MKRLARISLVTLAVLALLGSIGGIVLYDELRKAHSEDPLVWEEDVAALVEASRVRGALQDPVIFIGIKPTPLRFGVWNEVQEANRLIREFCDGDPRLHYIETRDAMLGPDG